MKFTVKGENQNEKKVQEAIELSQGKYCSITSTLRGEAEITTSFEILSD